MHRFAFGAKCGAVGAQIGRAAREIVGLHGRLGRAEQAKLDELRRGTRSEGTRGAVTGSAVTGVGRPAYSVGRKRIHSSRRLPPPQPPTAESEQQA